MPKRYAHWLMIACLLVAAALRLPHLLEAPPGLHYDEAANAILAGDIGLRGARPVFISSYTGKEALFFYAAGGLMALIGESVFALRLTAVFIGLFTIAVTYALGRELFKKREVAFFAAVLLATSFWHLLFSRLGFRAISQPLLQGLTVLLVLKGLKMANGQLPTANDQLPITNYIYFSLAGLFLGLSAYTYLAVRLFPILLAVAAVPLLKTWRRWWKAAVLMLVIALLTLAPLLWYFITHPEAFWVRIEQVGGDGLTLSEGVLKTLAMFSLTGDPYWRFNVPEMPLFDPLLSFFLVAGLLALLGAWRQFTRPSARFGLVLLLAAPVIMSLPTALATNEIVPSNLRAIGLLPFVMFLPAYGVVRVWEIVRTQDRPWVLPTVALVLLCGYGVLTYHRYVNQWAARADVFYENDSDLAAVADYLNQKRFETPVYVGALHYPHPTLAFLADHYDELKLLVESRALAIPADGRATYIFPHSSLAPVWMRPLLAQARREEGPLGPDGAPTFVAYHMTRLPVLQPAVRTQATMGNALTLAGYDVGSGSSGTNLPLTLYWQIQAQPAAVWMPFVHVEDQWRYRWGQSEQAAYPSAQWAQGEIVVQQISVPLREGMPPGRYRLRVGVFDAETQAQLAIFDGNGRYAGSGLTIEDVFVLEAAAMADPVPRPPQQLDAAPRPMLNLLGYEVGRRNLTNGEPLWVSLWWEATDKVPPTLNRLELIRPNNVGVILLDSQPAHGTYPFEQWRTPVFVIDHQTAEIPLNLDEGSYQLQLRSLDGTGQTLGTYPLGEVIVQATERSFTPPALAVESEAVFGGQIALLGYTLDGLSLELVWQALERPAADYTVFVHVLNQDGSCCVWQQDLMPQQGDYPTSLWLPEEVVVDRYVIELPGEVASGDYPIEVGLFIAESGVRLAVETSGAGGADFVYLRPLVVE